MEQLLAGKNAFITGAGANIGRAIALEMAAHGARIYFADKDAARAAALEAELRARGVTAQSFVYDISKPASVDAILDGLRQKEIALDILVNNVGITTVAPETSPQAFEHWQQVMDTNVLAPLYLSRRVAQEMIEHQTPGSILFISSIHQWVFHGGELYGATKAGVGMIVKELAVSLAQHGIRVNAIAPGACREQDDGAPIPHNGTPLYHEHIKPHYIGRAAVFLCSDYFSHHTTGATLTVDGGLSLFDFNNRNIISPLPVPSFPKARSWVRRGYQYLGKIRGLKGQSAR